MRSSLNIRGILAVAVVAAGASWLGAGSASAAVPCGEGPLTALQAPGTAPEACDGLGGLTVPHVANRGAGNGRGDLLIGFEHIGRSSGLLSGTAAVIGLTDLPAIVRSTGLPHLLKGELLYRVARGHSVPGVLQYEGRPAQRRAIGSSDVPDAPATSGTAVSGDPGAPAVGAGTGLPVLPVVPPAVGAPVQDPGTDAAGAELAKLPSVDTALTGLHVR
ncbi:hypothetical protein [Sphaerisporangium perillae]|uniref:hypothetical protein n=1 Tax=Sphaerisporangium perillae TaxID=2935860 RepID=UPI00200BE2E6|nr:hypothetical protein [Sphaerisporangium perillae]